MISAISSSKLTRWETPFSDIELPDNSLELRADGSAAFLVHSGKFERDVIHRVVFDSYFAAFTYDESSQRPVTDFEIPDDIKGCCFIVVNSPWVEAFSHELEQVGCSESKRLHYVILGGASVIEIVSVAEPRFEA